MLLDHFVFKNNETISIGDNDYIFDSLYRDRQDVISGLKKINIFLGANNSGKSRILRAIFSQSENMNVLIFEKLFNYLSELNELFDNSRIAKGQLSTVNDFLKGFSSITTKSFLSFDSNLFTEINDSKKKLDGVLKDPGVFLINSEEIFVSNLRAILEKYSDLFLDINKNFNYHKLYIPTLRGMRPLENNDFYFNRTVKDYFHSVDLKNKDIFTGFTIYGNIKNKLLGKQSDRDFIKEYEIFLGSNFFNDCKITLIPREEFINERQNDVVYITFDNNEEDERAIFDLGDGLQSIILITFPLFEWAYHNVDNNTFLVACIEEPELYLHPSMQRKLIEVLMSEKFNKIQFMITTHSNHFLDLINNSDGQDQISFYSVFNKSNKKYVRQENDLSDSVYNLLGAKPSSVLLSNKTIWVEGVSDRMYIRHGIYLYFEEKKEKKIVEYLDYAFVEYSGTNLDHYFKDDGEQDDIKISSLSNISNVFLIADDDGVYSGDVKSEKRSRYDKVKKSLGENFKITDGWEIENYISPSILKKVFKFSEDINSQDEYLSEKLPIFLKNRCGVKKFISNDKTPRFQNKKNIALKAIKEQKKWEDLSSEMQKLITTIINFIKK